MTTTAILFTCTECKLNGFAKPEWVGKKVKCPRCGHTSRVPGPDQAAAPEVPTAEVPAPEATATPTQLQIPLPALEAINGAAAETLHDIHVKASQASWEYQVIRHDPAVAGDLSAKLAEDMNVRGAEGWECVGMFQQPVLFVVYKRQANK